MGCQTEVTIGDYLTFSVTTHNPATAALADATGAPAYRIYEDETAAPILTGNMAILDDVNTTGFYTERILCSAANGFEDGKSYTIYIAATVAGVQGGISYGFRALAESTGTITVVGPVAEGGDVVTYRGDDYDNADGRALEWSSDDWPDLTAGTVAVIIDRVAQFAGSVVTPVGPPAVVRLELTAAQSRSISVGRHNFQVVATQADSDVATLVAAAWVSRERAEV